MGIMGRPRKEIDIKEFEKLCHLQCTKDEIASWFEMTHETLETRIQEYYGETFSTIYGQKKGKGKIALRRFQMHQAEKSAAMAIFLGKNYLGQKDNQDVSVDIKPHKLFDTSKMTKEEYVEMIREELKKKAGDVE